MDNSQYFDREMFRRNLPEDKQDWYENKITRYLNKMCEWGLIKKIENNKYELLRDVILDFSMDK